MLVPVAVLLLLCGTLGLTSGSTLKPFHDMNMKEALKYLYEKLSLLENREASDLAEKIKAEIKDELATKLAEMEVKHNDLSTKLEERMSREKESLDEVSGRLLKERDERLSMDNHILMEVHQLQRRAFESAEKINNVKSEIASVSEGGGSRTDMLEVKINENKDLIHSCLASQRNTEEAIWKNMSSLVEKLRTNVNESLTTRIADIQSNVTSKIGNLENTLLALRENCVNATSVDKIMTILANHSSSILSLNTRLTRIQTVCDPPCQNGGVCKENNTCSCTPLFGGDRCQNDHPQCGHVLRNVGVNGGGIVGGNTNTSASTPDWPWLAAVYRKKETFLNPKLKCGGSIIHRLFILITADCLYDWDDRRTNENDITVRLGTADQRDLTHLQEYNVKTIYEHPLYNSSKYYDYDIALLELEKPMDYNLYVRPVCLPPEEKPGDNRFYEPQSSAHGILWHLDSGTYIAKEIPFVIQPPDVCSQKLEDNRKQNFTDRMFCATKEVRGPCVSSWSALALQSHLNEDGARIWTQMGMHGGGCWSVRMKSYSVFIRLQRLMTWVDKTIQDALKG